MTVASRTLGFPHLVEHHYEDKDPAKTGLVYWCSNGNPHYRQYPGCIRARTCRFFVCLRSVALCLHS